MEVGGDTFFLRVYYVIIISIIIIIITIIITTIYTADRRRRLKILLQQCRYVTSALKMMAATAINLLRGHAPVPAAYNIL